MTNLPKAVFKWHNEEKIEKKKVEIVLRIKTCEKITSSDERKAYYSLNNLESWFQYTPLRVGDVSEQSWKSSLKISEVKISDRRILRRSWMYEIHK